MREGLTPQTKRKQESKVSVSGPVRIQTVRSETRDVFSLSAVAR